MTVVLYAGDTAEGQAWRDRVLALRPGLDFRLDIGATDPGDVDILVYEASGPLKDLAPYAGVAAIQNLWAGVEAILANPTLPADTTLCRMVEPGLTIGMTDYVAGHVLRLHLGMDRHRDNQTRGIWTDDNPPLSTDRRVGIVGLGVLGRDVAEKLAVLRFDVSGWSRSAKRIDGVRCLHGPEGFDTLLAESDILVLLAPLTPETENLIDAESIARMKPGAHLINVARGAMIDDDALLAALDSGQVASATLDVFRIEPLPAEHPYWGHPSVTISPHIASITRPETAARTIVEQVDRFERGDAFVHVVDRKSGY
jgi:glyoxylate/hydroxypyruvate reductase A